jgi:hypothetical protein
MSEDDELAPRPLTFRFNPERTELCVVPVRLDVVGDAQIVLGYVRPDLPKSRIAGQWAAALEFSPGSGMLAQLVTRPDDRAEEWGPCEMVWPEVDDALDDEITDEGLGGFLLGWDLLQKVVITFVGPEGFLAFTLPITPEGETPPT